MPPRVRLLAGAAALALLLAACGGAAAPTSTPQPTPTPTPTPAPLPPAVQVLVGGTDIAVGPNRLLLAVLDGEGRPVSQAQLHLRFFFLDGDDPQSPRAEVDALFVGEGIETAQALYSGRATFDVAGSWDVEAVVRKGGQGPLLASARFQVKAKSDAPGIGEPAPPSRNQTLLDVPIEQLTSERPPGDREFYRLTIAEALEQRKPFMVLFSTPAFCQTRTCGPQLDATQALRLSYGDQMNFIHIEVFERPDQLLAGQGQPRVRPTIGEWGLRSDPWVFIVDGQGRVHDRFEGFASAGELEQSVLALLAKG